LPGTALKSSDNGKTIYTPLQDIEIINKRTGRIINILHLFEHPYTKIEFIVNDLNVSRITAANYLNKLAEDGLVRKEKLGTGTYYINEQLFELLSRR